MSGPVPVHRYRIVREIGRGGLGVVYHAVDLVMGREVALKTFRPDRTASEAGRHRFLQEVRLTSRLSHHGTVAIYGVHRDAAGQPWYAMRLIDGEDLRAWLTKFHQHRRASKARLDLGLLHSKLRRMVVICGAVGHAHARGVVHRDIKPTNLMIGRDGDSYVLDWGMAGRWPAAGGDDPDAAQHEFLSTAATDPHRPESNLLNPQQIGALIDGPTPLEAMMLTRIVVEGLHDADGGAAGPVGGGDAPPAPAGIELTWDEDHPPTTPTSGGPPADLPLSHRETRPVDQPPQTPASEGVEAAGSARRPVRPGELAPDSLPERLRPRRLYGTLSYASPEQLHPETDPVGPPSDVYALGATLYELLTGAEPHRLDHPDDAHEFITSGKVPPPQVLVPEIPRRLAAVCRRAMAIRPEDRYQTAAELAADLAGYLDDLPIVACPDAWPDRATRWLRRHQRIALVGLTGLTVLLISSLATVGVLRAETRRAQELAARTERMRIEAVTRRYEAEGERAASQAARRRTDLVVEVIIGCLALARQRDDIQVDALDAVFADAAEQVRRGERSPELRASAFDLLADSYLAIGRVEPAVALSRDAVALQRMARGTGDPQTLAYEITHRQALEAAGQLADPEAAWEDLANRAAESPRAGYRCAAPLVRSALAAERTGDWPRVIERLETVLDYWEADHPMSRLIGVSKSLLGRARAEMHAGDVTAEDLLTEGLRLVRDGDGALPGGRDHLADATDRLARYKMLATATPPPVGPGH